jgi:hypothetical protein
VARAASALDTLSQDALKTPLRPAERGDLLLTQGDLASARGDARRAKEEYDAAALLVDASALVRPRVDRLAEADRQRRVLLAALFGDLDLLLRAAENGDANAVTSRGAELAPRIATLGNKDAEAKLSSAVAAAQRVVMRPRGAGVDVDALVGARPRAPVRSAAQTPEADALYEAQHAAYVEAIAEWERKRTEAERARQEQSAAAPAAGELSLDEARKQIDEVRSALEAGSGPPP